MEATHEEISQKLFTTLPISSLILPYYGYAHMCKRLMTKLRKGSYYLWQRHYSKWAQLKTIKKKIVVIAQGQYHKLQWLVESATFFLYDINIIMPTIFWEEWFNATNEFINQIQKMNGKSGEPGLADDHVDLLSLKITILNNSVVRMDEHRITLAFQNLLKVCAELKRDISYWEISGPDESFTNIVQLPEIFEINNVWILIDKALVVDQKAKELPKLGTAHALFKTIKADCSRYLVSTPAVFLEKFVLGGHQFNANQTFNWKELVIMEIHKFDTLSGPQIDRCLRFMQTMGFLDRVWFYTNNQILQLNFAKRMLREVQAPSVSIIIETAISDNEGSYNFEITKWILTQYDEEDDSLKINFVEYWDLIAYSTKHVYLFQHKFVIFTEFEIKNSKITKIWTSAEDENLDKPILDYQKVRSTIQKICPEFFHTSFGLIVPIDSLKSMKFSFSFPYKSAKFTEKQHSLMDTFANILKLQRISGIANFIDILNSHTKISIKQDECFMSEGQIKSVIPRRYNIHDFMIDLCELKEPKLITTFPISVSVIRDYSEVIESFLGKFKSLRRVICIDDIEEGFLEESIIPLLLIMCARCLNISSIEVPGFLFETDQRFLKSYADQYISIDISCISPR